MAKDSTFDIKGLQKALRNTPQNTISGILKSMLESFREQICINECQFNRVVCILRPKCTQRHFLDLLLLSGYEHANIPQFCYSVRLKEINDNYKKNPHFSSITSDISIFLTDFYRIFDQNKPRFHYKRDFKKILAFFSITNYIFLPHTYVVAGLNKNLVFIDFDRELVTLNPLKWKLIDPELLRATLLVFSKEFSVNLEITENFDNNLVLTFSFPNSKESLDENQLDDALRRSDTLMSFDDETNEIFAEIQIPHANSEGFDDFTVEFIRTIFEELNEIRPKEVVKEKIKDKSKNKSVKVERSKAISGK